jgi:L-iditol 2-dehydrogenase
MNTAVLIDQEKLSFQERQRPVLQAGEVLVEVAYCGVCRTDRKAYRAGQRDLHLPRVLGHEFAGTVLAVGEGVKEIFVGDKVQVHPGIGCHQCDDCLSGNDQRCARMNIFGFHLDGGFSRYCVIPSAAVKAGIINIVPKEVPLFQAALVEPMACAIHMLDQMDLMNNEDLLLTGGGVLGCLMAKICRYLGMNGKILIVEPNKKKRVICDALGFQTISIREAEKKIKEIWPNGIDAAIPCCPVNSGMELSLKVLKNDGKFGFFSGLTGDEPISRQMINLMHYKELKVSGAYGCGVKDGKKALKLLQDGFDVTDLPINFISLADVEKTLCQIETTDHLITMIRYD